MPYFLGREPPPAPLTTTCQKCFRTPDIDEVGLDTYHLTFFEMLGNFSFGQYFKEGAIEFATEFIREHLKLDWDRIWVERPRGRPRAGARPRPGRDRPLGEDRHAAGADRAAAVVGELLVGRRPRAVRARLGDLLGLGRGDAAAASPTACPGCTRCERFLEFWNLVFMEYELHADGTLTPLPKQNIDTGLGPRARRPRSSRTSPSVYDTDGYQLIMGWIAARVGRRATATRPTRRRRTACSPTTAAA